MIVVILTRVHTRARKPNESLAELPRGGWWNWGRPGTLYHRWFIGSPHELTTVANWAPLHVELGNARFAADISASMSQDGGCVRPLSRRGIGSHTTSSRNVGGIPLEKSAEHIYIIQRIVISTGPPRRGSSPYTVVAFGCRGHVTFGLVAWLRGLRS